MVQLRPEASSSFNAAWGGVISREVNFNPFDVITNDIFALHSQHIEQKSHWRQWCPFMSPWKIPIKLELISRRKRDSLIFKATIYAIYR